MPKSCEQLARDILERMEVAGAQSRTSGDLVELANLVQAALMAIADLHYGGSHGGLSERECRESHDRVVRMSGFERSY